MLGVYSFEIVDEWTLVIISAKVLVVPSRVELWDYKCCDERQMPISGEIKGSTIDFALLISKDITMRNNFI